MIYMNVCQLEKFPHERRGDWMQTYTGRQFWPIDPRPEDLSIIDIAHALSLLCRYNGHCTKFYSVAEHSVLMAGFASPENALCALLHDAAEAYLSDVPRPAKRFLANYKSFEHQINECVAHRFGLPYPWPQEVIELDNRILADEKEQIMAPAPADWHLPLPPLGVHLPCYAPADAEALFLSTFNRLVAQNVAS